MYSDPGSASLEVDSRPVPGRHVPLSVYPPPIYRVCRSKVRGSCIVWTVSPSRRLSQVIDLFLLLTCFYSTTECFSYQVGSSSSRSFSPGTPPHVCRACSASGSQVQTVEMQLRRWRNTSKSEQPLWGEKSVRKQN